MKIKLIKLSKYGFIEEPRYYFFGWSTSPLILGRDSAVRALLRARKFLPKGYNFKIWDMQRPRKVQIAMLKSFQRRFSQKFPRLSRKKLIILVYKFGAKPALRVTRLDTHRNGGAVDLTILNAKGEELFMGTDHDDLTEKAATDYFEKKKILTILDKEARKNRRMLIKAMTIAGFENYSPEWWHWSYDK